jgi:hypothetical protein
MNPWFKLVTSAACLCVSGLCIAANQPAEQRASKTAKAKWVFMFKGPEAQIKKTKTGTIQLVINDPKDTNVYMLNDRPFYLIRKIQQVGSSLWSGFAKSNYRPNQKIDATVIINNKPNEVRLSHYQWKNGIPTYTIESTSKVAPLQPTKGPMIMFVSTESKPLCNLMNELRHDATSLRKLEDLNS